MLKDRGSRACIVATIMRSSPRKRSGHTSCQGEVSVTTVGQLARLAIGELRYQAGEQHGIKNASLMSRADLVERLSKHFLTVHGVDLVEQGGHAGATVDRLREGSGVGREQAVGREDDREQGDLVIQEMQDIAETEMVIQSSEGRSQVVMQGRDGSMVIQELTMEESLEGGQYILQTGGQVVTGEEVVTEYEEVEDYMNEEGGLTNMRYKIGRGETVDDDAGEGEMVIQVLPKTVCHAYVIAKTVKELRDLGRDMLRIHAENHGIEHAQKLRMSELVREMIQHYNGVHNAGMEVSKLDMLKLNMLTLKKIKVDIREKTPPPDTSSMVPKNVVPIEEQVHHVYEKRPDICTVDIIVNNLKDMLALGTSILRPEASKHRVCNSSRKQKLQVVEELWEHYLKFHLKQTEHGGLERRELVGEGGEEYAEYRWRGEGGDQDYIVVSEEDIVAGEDIHTAAEEVTA